MKILHFHCFLYLAWIRSFISFRTSSENFSLSFEIRDTIAISWSNFGVGFDWNRFGTSLSNRKWWKRVSMHLSLNLKSYFLVSKLAHHFNSISTGNSRSLKTPEVIFPLRVVSYKLGEIWLVRSHEISFLKKIVSFKLGTYLREYVNVY